MSLLSIERILVALDASADSQAALRAAATLAESLDAELIGLFVEDINLLRAAALPFTQEVRFPSATAKNVDKLKMERQLRNQAEQARQQLRIVAAERKISWSFRVARGPVAAELLAATAEADLLALGRVSRPFRRSRQMGSTARSAVSQAKRPVLLMHPGVDLNRPILLIYDGTPTSERALSAAARLAQASGSLRVLLCAQDDAEARQYEEHIKSQLKKSAITPEFRRLHQFDPENLAYILRLSGVELLVLGRTAQLPPEILQAMLDKLDHPVLVVR